MFHSLATLASGLGWCIHVSYVADKIYYIFLDSLLYSSSPSEQYDVRVSMENFSHLPLPLFKEYNISSVYIYIYPNKFNLLTKHKIIN